MSPAQIWFNLLLTLKIEILKKTICHCPPLQLASE
jgi:hypothetical protein